MFLLLLLLQYDMHFFFESIEINGKSQGNNEKCLIDVFFLSFFKLWENKWKQQQQQKCYHNDKIIVNIKLLLIWIILSTSYYYYEMMIRMMMRRHKWQRERGRSFIFVNHIFFYTTRLTWRFFAVFNLYSIRRKKGGVPYFFFI